MNNLINEIWIHREKMCFSLCPENIERISQNNKLFAVFLFNFLTQINMIHLPIYNSLDQSIRFKFQNLSTLNRILEMEAPRTP